jgi:hypothetical protein
MLLNVSGSRELAMTMNEPFQQKVKFDIPLQQPHTYLDLLFVMIYKLIQAGPRLLKPIYKSIIAILANVAPYCKSLQRESCDGLIYLVQVFSKREFLLEREDNAKTCTGLFEALNYLIAYHDETHQHLQI